MVIVAVKEGIGVSLATNPKGVSVGVWVMVDVKVIVGNTVVEPGTRILEVPGGQLIPYSWHIRGTCWPLTGWGSEGWPLASR